MMCNELTQSPLLNRAAQESLHILLVCHLVWGLEVECSCLSKPISCILAASQSPHIYPALLLSIMNASYELQYGVFVM